MVVCMCGDILCPGRIVAMNIPMILSGNIIMFGIDGIDDDDGIGIGIGVAE